MARCPRCTRHFQVMEDERPEDHGCPSCGYGTEQDIKCLWCNGDFNDMDEDTFMPYCSDDCAGWAERDSMEDSE